MGKWEVYIIEAASGKLYTGITNNMQRRFEQHLKHKGASFFHFSKAEKIVFRESCKDRSIASKREAEIKKMSRAQKLELIKKNN